MPRSRTENQCFLNPNVARAGGSQSQGARGDAVALYCDPLATLDLAFSGFPGRVKKRENYRYALDCTLGEIIPFVYHFKQ
jgi:hypothetical protein